MTDPEWEVVGQYVDLLRRELLLDAWDIIIEREPPNGENSEAETFIVGESNTAKMRFCHDFRQMPPEKQRVIVLHELMHFFTDRFASDTDEVLESALPKVGYEAIHGLLVHAYERMNDAIAVAIAPKYPLVEWENDAAFAVTFVGTGRSPEADR